MKDSHHLGDRFLHGKSCGQGPMDSNGRPARQETHMQWPSSTKIRQDVGQQSIGQEAITGRLLVAGCSEEHSSLTAPAMPNSRISAFPGGRRMLGKKDIRHHSASRCIEYTQDSGL